MPAATSSASVYRERGRVWVRMELSEDEYGLMREALWDHGRNGKNLVAALTDGEREKTGELDWKRYDGAPKVGD